MLVHIEVQGYDDPGFAKRMFTYFYRILDTYNKPVTSIVIFTDSNKNFRPNSFTYNFPGASVEYKFNTYKIIDQGESELAKSKNPFAIVVLTVLLALKKGKIPEEKLYSLKFELGRKLLGLDIEKEKARAIMNFLRYYVRFDNKENITKFEEQIHAITNKKITMGIEELLLYTAEKQGIEKGRESGANAKTIEFTTSLLLGTDHSIEKIASLVGVPVSFVEAIKKSLGL